MTRIFLYNVLLPRDVVTNVAMLLPGVPARSIRAAPTRRSAAAVAGAARVRAGVALPVHVS